MPVECVLLEDRPVPIAKCPKCGAEPFAPFIRGTIQRRKFRYFFFEEWPYCALICSTCKEIVDYESPPKIVFDSEKVYAKKRCAVCQGRLRDNSIMVTRHSPDGKPLNYHAACYETISASLPPPPPPYP
jgi:formate dehydrogenase maturation protein FdhE